MRKFISCLGTGNYMEVSYYLGNPKHSYRTKFIQEALLNLLPQEEKPDEIIIATTEAAFEKHWQGENGLEERLAVSVDAPYRNIMIPDGRTEEEIWQLFHIILGELGEGDEIIVDITYVFRFIPMIMISVLNYAKTVKQISVRAIYYGFYEPGTDKQEFPIFNLGIYDEILDWTYATNVFLQYGNAKTFHDMASVKMRNLRKHADDETRNKASRIESTTKALDRFTRNIMTGRGGIQNADAENTILFSYKKLSRFLEQAITMQNDTLDILVPLLERIRKETDIFDTDEVDGRALEHVGMATIQWCLNKHMIPQALTAMTETIVTHICLIMGENERAEDRDFRENVANASIQKRLSSMGIASFEYRVETTEEEKEQIELLNDGSQDQLIKVAQKVKTLRNDINHFGLSKNKINTDRIEKDAIKMYEQMKRLIPFHPVKGKEERL